MTLRQKLGTLAGCGAVLAFSAAAYTCLNGCAAVEADAQKYGADITAACVVVDSTDNSWLQFACATVEAADRLLARLPAASKKDPTHVQCPIPSFAGVGLDAGSRD